jgi:hypothetical protein
MEAIDVGRALSGIIGLVIYGWIVDLFTWNRPNRNENNETTKEKND